MCTSGRVDALGVVFRRGQIRGAFPVRTPSVRMSQCTRTHTEVGSCTWVARTRHSQPLLVPYTHTDTRSHPGRHDTQALPGPDARPSRRRLEIPIRPGLHKHGLDTVPAEPAAGWGSTMANGVVGSPPYPAWLCPPGGGASALKFPMEFSILQRNHGLGGEGDVLGPRSNPLLGPQPRPGHFSCAGRRLSVL